MSCRRAFEIDLVDFVAEPARAEFAEFRAHYPGCAECSTEVRAWTEVVVLLRESAPPGNGAHPEPALLLRYEQHDAALTAARRSELERHLAVCASCRDELGALRAFPFESLAPRAAKATRERAPWLPRVRALVLHPAFAYALVAVLLWPASLALLRMDEVAPMQVPRAEAEVGEARKSSELRADDLAEYSKPTAVPAPVARVAESEASRGAALERSIRKDVDRLRVAEHQEFGAAAAEPAFAAASPSEPALRVAVPQALRESGGVELVVHSADGLRELRERLRAPVASPYTVRLPRSWPPQRSYSIELRALDEAGAREPVYRLDVEP